MTQEDKQLLFKDLCARLPYGVKVNATTPKGEKVGTIVTITTKFIYSRQDPKIFGEFYVDDNDECFWLDFGLFKPYLRPLSSMTEEERNEWMDITHAQEWLIIGNLDKATDWLNVHHFDYRGLIPMDLALEAKEGMYKID